MAIQRLTAAYRSRSRPSSTLGAKASTMRPYYLDGDLGRGLAAPPGDTHNSLATVQFSRSAKSVGGAGVPTGPRMGLRELAGAAGLSKLNSMHPR